MFRAQSNNKIRTLQHAQAYERSLSDFLRNCLAREAVDRDAKIRLHAGFLLLADYYNGINAERERYFTELAAEYGVAEVSEAAEQGASETNEKEPGVGYCGGKCMIL